MANLTRIVDVQISLNTSGISRLGFSTLLIVGVHNHSQNRVNVYTDSDDMLTDGFTASDPIYLFAVDAFAQTPRPAQVKIGRRAANESIADTLAAITAEDNDWYGWCLTSRTPADILAAAEWTEAHTKIFGTSVSEADALDSNSTTDTLYKLKDENYFRTFAYYHQKATTESIEAAIMARCFSILPGGETWANKRLASITADNLTETQFQTIKNKNGNTFEKFRNISITQRGIVAAGEWIDIIRFRDWLQEEITVNVFTALVNNNKVPYTDEGIAIIENQIRAALDLGTKRGGIAPDEYDENGDINRGYMIEVPLASTISANKKASRILDDVKFTARVAGAIHVVKIYGNLTYENLIVGGYGV